MAKKKDKTFLGKEEWESFSQEYEKADDRSCALLGAAYLDHCLEILLLRALHNPEEAKKGLFGETMPLGTFSAKIKMAFCLNIIHKSDFDDLNRIRKIRNAFAHQLHGLRFSQDPIKSLACSLKFPAEYLDGLDWTVESVLNNDPRQMYIFTCSVLSHVFEDHYLKKADNINKALLTIEQYTRQHEVKIGIGSV